MYVRQVIPRDAIPSVDDPTFRDRYGGESDDRVVVVDSVDPPRAYPVRYLDYHEIVNDVVDGKPIAVTWCPLCGSAVVYDRRHAGRTLEFGVSGKLADDDLVMYDREYDSEWKQSSGDCIAGRFEGASLSVLPAAIVPWKRFRDSYPDGVVLQPPGGESEAASDDGPAPIEYDRSPYDAYFEMDGFGLDAHRGDGSRDWDRNDDLSPKTVVLGIEEGDHAAGVPLPRVRQAGGIVRTTVAGQDIVVFATEDAGIHGYRDPGYAFELVPGEEEGDSRVVADGTTWDPATGEAADGRELDRLSTRRTFAFAWQDDHGSDAFYGSPSLE